MIVIQVGRIKRLVALVSLGSLCCWSWFVIKLHLYNINALDYNAAAAAAFSSAVLTKVCKLARLWGEG